MRSETLVRNVCIALLLPLVGIAGACDDLGGPNLEDFDPAHAAASLDSVLVAMEDDGEYFSSFDLAADAIATQDGTATASYTLGALNRVAPTIGTMGAIPAEFLGTTYVYDPAANEGAGGYVVDPERGDAPANAIRFVYYAMNPATGLPAEPVHELGYLDLIDETPEGALDRVVLAIRVVDTTGEEPVTLVDYGIDFSASSTSTGGELSYDVVGFISNGTDQLDFDLAHSIIVSDGGSIDLAVNHTFIRPSHGVTVIATADATGALLEEGGTGTQTLTVRNGGEEVYVEVTLNENGTLSGTVRYGGIDVVTIGGTADRPEFTRADGSELSESDIAALEKLRSGFEAVSELAAEILGAFDEVG